jgi:hypothetical protein
MGAKVHHEKPTLSRRAKHIQAAHEKRLSSDFEAEDCVGGPFKPVVGLSGAVPTSGGEKS